MNYLSKIVWFEGMYLAPQHFQAQNRAFDGLVHFTTSTLWFEPYGLVGYELDAEALRNGVVSLVHARGFFPDGLAFHVPQNDPPPPARSIDDWFPPTCESLKVYLAVPPHKPQGSNCAITDQQKQDHMRYIAEVSLLHDENTGRDEKPVHLGRKNMQFLFETESQEDLITVPIGRIMRDGAGHLIYDAGFIPPCLQISASPRLMLIVRRLVDILAEKSATLSQARRGASTFRAGFSSEDVASFWFVHAVNSSLSVLRHLYLSERGHPEQLYVEMARLGGALCTFGLESQPQSLPAYDHLQLDRCFGALDEHIRKHLELVVPTNYVQIALTSAGRYSFEGSVTDQRCVGRSRWILAIRSDIGEADLISRAPRLVKICSSQLLPELVKTALPGLTLTHLPVPPSAIAPKVDYQYFGVSKAGACWEHIVETRKVGVYIPGELPSPEVELLVLLES
jgi:type VI secretion system protein ImpJ